MSDETAIVPIEAAALNIRVVRGTNAILDEDLAALYGVETKVLTQSVRRNIDRFPLHEGIDPVVRDTALHEITHHCGPEEDDMKRIARTLVVVAAVCLALAGCAAGTPEPPDAEPDIRGVVTAVSGGSEGSASLRVVWTDDEAVGAQAAYDAAQLTVTGDTEVIARAATGSSAVAEIADIAVGSVVEAWFEGPVAESYPVQATAGTLVILGTYSGELPEPPGLSP